MSKKERDRERETTKKQTLNYRMYTHGHQRRGGERDGDNK